MKELLTGIGIVAIGVFLAGAAGLGILGLTNNEIAEPNVGGGFSIDNAYYLSTTGGTFEAGEKSATTTEVFIATTNTATTTITGFTGRASTIDLNLQLTASTTATKLRWFVSFSPNNIDWYKEDCSSVDSTILVTHGASACVHEWTPADAVASTTRKNVTIGAAQAKFFKVDFGVSGANGALWAQAIPKEDTPN